MTDNQFTQMFEFNKQQFALIDRRFTKIDKQFTTVDQRFKAIDARFEQMFNHFDKRFEAVDSRFESMFTYFDKRIDGLEERLTTNIDSKFDRLLASDDRDAKKYSDLETEQTMLAKQVDRHEAWHHKTAKKLGIKLEF